MPSTTSHWSWPGLTRASSGCGSGRLLTGTARASSISFLVRWLMKIGLPRQNTLMSCPEAIGARSTSIGAPAAMVEASGFIWEMNGQRVAAPPPAAAAPVATKRKSRRVGCSAEDAVVTIPNPFPSCSRWNRPRPTHRRPKGGCRRPRRQKDHLSQPIGRNKQSRIVLLAPLPEERKPAIGWLACDALNPRRAMIYSVISWGTEGPSPNADCAFPARHPAEYGYDSAPLRVP